LAETALKQTDRLKATWDSLHPIADNYAAKLQKTMPGMEL
jgi:hypothetical protein